MAPLPRLHVCVILAPADLPDLRRHAARLEEIGVDSLGLADSPRLCHDPYVAAAEAAHVTSRMPLGPMVANFVTRDPVVTARALASVEAIAGPGRAFAGLGAGYTGVASAGRPRSTVAGLREGIGQFREAAELMGARLPVVVAAAGPKTLAMGGEHADVIVTGAGVDATSVAEVVGHARSAQPWVLARTSVRPDRRLAVEELLPVLASGAVQLFSAAPARATLSPQELERIDVLRQRFDYGAHGKSRGNPNPALVEELGLVELLADRFAVTGTAAQVAARFAGFARAGATGVVIPAVGVDVDRLVDGLSEVLPLLRQAEGAPAA